MYACWPKLSNLRLSWIINPPAHAATESETVHSTSGTINKRVNSFEKNGTHTCDLIKLRILMPFVSNEFTLHCQCMKKSLYTKARQPRCLLQMCPHHFFLAVKGLPCSQFCPLSTHYSFKPHPPQNSSPYTIPTYLSPTNSSEPPGGQMSKQSCLQKWDNS